MALKINDKIYKRKVKKLERYVRTRLPKETLSEFKSLTPKDSGNARRNTKVTNRTKKGFTVIGDYNYSGVIDQGMYPFPPKAGTGKTSGGYSTQSPKGMTGPTEKWLKRTLTDFIKRLTRGT